MKEEEVTISKTEYEELIEDSLLLEALFISGVDNWDFWDESIELYNSMKKSYKSDSGQQ